jgi:hypothetical protein
MNRDTGVGGAAAAHEEVLELYVSTSPLLTPLDGSGAVVNGVQ